VTENYFRKYETLHTLTLRLFCCGNHLCYVKVTTGVGMGV